METDKTLIKIAGISYGLLGCLLLDFPTLGIIVIMAGVFLYLLSTQSDERVYNSRFLLLMIAIVGMFNILGAVLLFISFTSICKNMKVNGTNAPPEKKVIDKESRRIDILLKLGVGMVFLSAFLLSTTSWNFITDQVKVLSLFALGILFLLLSILTEKRFKLYNSSYMYWILSMSLFIFSVVGLLYFRLLGDAFTYYGPGKMLSYATTWFVVSLLFVITYFKYTKNSLLYFSYASLALTLYYLLSFLQLSIVMSLSIISLMIMLFNIINHKKSAIYYFSKAFSYLLFILVLKYQSSASIGEHIFSSIVTLINLNYFTFLYPDDNESLLSILCSYLLICISVTPKLFIDSYIYLPKALIYSIYSLLIGSNIIKCKDIAKKISYCTFSLVMLVLSLFAISIGSYPNFIVNPVLVVLVFVMINVILKYGLFGVTKWKVAYYIEPIVLLLLVTSVLKTLSPRFDMVYILGTTSVIASMIHVLTKDKLAHRIYSFFIAIVLFFGMVMCNEFIHIFASILLIGSSLYLFVNTYLKHKDTNIDKLKIIVSYVLLLSSITIPYVYYNILSLEIFIPIIMIIVLALLISAVLGNKYLKKTTYIFIAFPMFALLNYVDIYSLKAEIICDAILLYIAVLLIHMLIKNNQTKNILTIICVVSALLPLITIEDINVSLYIGVIGLIMILLTLNRSELSPIFITGIIITVINIIYSLRSIWVLIPFWLYLLIGGLIIIVSVLIKEIRKK